MHRTVGAALVIAVLFILAPTPTPALAEPAAVDFAEVASLPVQGGKPAYATLVNNTASTYDVAITAVISEGVGEAEPTPSAMHLGPGGIAVVGVTASSSAKAEGFLVAIARSGRAPAVVARRRFQIEPMAAWKPLVAGWRVTSLQGPVANGLRNAALPLAGGGGCGSTDSSLVVGAVARPAGGSAVVTATCRRGKSSVDLSFDGLAEAGDYEGRIDLSPDREGGDVALTVRRTDGLPYPVAFLLAGIALAMLASWQSGRLSALSQAREEAWLLQAEAAEIHDQFHLAGDGKPWQAYSFLTALRSRLDAVRADLRGLRWLVSEVAADKGPYKAQLDQLTELTRIVGAWKRFGGLLATLSAAREVLGSPGAGTQSPRIATHVGNLLSGEEITEVEGVLPLIADVEATLVALRAWPLDSAVVEELRDLGVRLEHVVPAEDRHRLETALAAVDAVRDGMWTAEDGAAYLALQVGTRLEGPKVELTALRRQYLRLVSTGAGRHGPDDSSAPTPEVRRSLSEAHESAAATARRIALSRRARNVAVFLAIGAVTAWAGLSALYFDRAFGTWRDYVAIGVWGFGAQAGLTVLAGALDRIIAGGKVVRP
jgi:hypothetical protein